MENLNSKEQTGSGNTKTEWDDMAKSVEEWRERSDRWENEQKYIEDAKSQEGYRRGLKVDGNAEKAEEIRKNIEVLYHMGDQENLKKEVEEDQKLDQKIQEDGKEEMQKGEVKNSVATRESAAEALARAQFIAGESAKVNAELAANGSFMKEKVEFNNLMSTYQRLRDPSSKPKGFFAERKHRKAKERNLKELRRYGFAPGSRSREIDMYEAPSYSGKKEYGEARARNYSELTTLAEGRYGRAVKKALKRRGFEGLPQDLCDRNFTAHELAMMRQEAESAVKALTRKEKK